MAHNMAFDCVNIANLYDTVATEYAAKFCLEHDSKPKDQEILQRFVKDIGRNRPVWDFGCGPGQTARYLKTLGLEVAGMDISEKILEQARILDPGMCFQKGNILDLEFENNSIAGIVAFYAIVHFTRDQLKRAFTEIFRVLKHDGMFLFTYHIGENTIHLDEFLGKRVDTEVMFFTNSGIISGLKACGFENIEIIEREPYPEVEYQSRRAYVFVKKPSVIA